MSWSNPIAAPDFDMRDVRSSQYALMNPIQTVLRTEGLGYVLLACAMYQVLDFSGLQFLMAFPVMHLGALKGMGLCS